MTVVDAAHPAKDGSTITGPYRKVLRGGRQRLGSKQQDLQSVQVDTVSTAQHGHAPDRPAVDVQPAAIVAGLQPHAALIHAEPHRQGRRSIGQSRAAFVIQPDAMHALTQRQVGNFVLGESKSEVVHAAAI